MKLCLLFDARSWESPPVRYAAEALARLLDLAWRSAPAASEHAADEIPLYIGDPAGAPDDAAAVIAAGEWGAWDPARIALARFEDQPLPCPGGELAPVPDPRTFPEAWLRAVWFMLSREEEAASPRRDRWECFSGTYSRLHELGVLEQPLIDLYAAQLGRRVTAWCLRRGGKLEKAARWKRGARFAAVLSHDVDDVRLYSLRQAWRLLRQAQNPNSYSFRAGLAGLARSLARVGRRGDPYWRFERWAAEESRRGFRSTFYFCPPGPSVRHEYDALYTMEDPVEFEGRRMPVADLIRKLAARGNEIGLHGSYLSHRDAAELARQKRQIEDATDCEVTGVRQHFLRFDVRETWGSQEYAGFRHDSTLGYNEAIGFRAGIAAPFRPWDPDRRGAMNLTELPLTVMDGALFRTMGLDAAGAARKVREHLERVEAVGGLAVLLWHPNAASEEHFPGWWECYLAALDHLAARGAWVASAGEVADWWRERDGRLSLTDAPRRR